MDKTVKEQWVEERREGILQAYPKFVKSIEKQNRAIEEKIRQRDELAGRVKSGDRLTQEQRDLLDFNPYSCGKILPREFKRHFGSFFEGAPFNDHIGAVEKTLGLDIRGVFRYSLSYFF